MRSRYTAFVRGAIDYLVDTYDPATRAPGERGAIEQMARDTNWLGLEVVATERGRADDEQGVVEFRARYRQGGVARVHHERSRFRRVDGLWRYVDGEGVKPKPVTRAPTVGRNDPCPCGSGKKFKKCCGA
jgi:SEC-C motif-containing protein